MSEVVTRAEGLVRRGDVRDAVDLLQKAMQAGDARAARELAIWSLTGQLVQRDLGAARTLFGRAASLGDNPSAAVTRAFMASGIGAPADWQGATRLLRKAATKDADADAQWRLIEAMDLGPCGEPLCEFHADTVCDAPDVRLFPSLFTSAECAYLIHAAARIMQPSVVVDPRTGRQVPNPVRTSSAAGFPIVDENPAIHALNRRLAAASNTDVRAGEPLQVLRYAPGEQYREHSDALPEVAAGQQRILTFLVYLDEDYEGGETSFPRLGLKIRGRRGNGLLFRNATEDGVPDERSVHSGLPVIHGVKHVASRWIRGTPLVLEGR